MTVKRLRPGLEDRIDVVFRDMDKPKQAKQRMCWLSSRMPGARVKGEQWYPVSGDSVVKHLVLAGVITDGRTWKDFFKNFQNRQRT